MEAINQMVYIGSELTDCPGEIISLIARSCDNFIKRRLAYG